MTRVQGRWAALFVVASVAVSSPAWADARLEARRHFKAGMADIAHGDYQTGIKELRLAYAIKPHPSVIYNIARAYQEMGRLDEAAESFRLFLASNPPAQEAAAVRTTLAQIEETIRISRPRPAPESPALPPPPRPGSPPPGADSAELEALVKRLEGAVKKLEEAPERPTEAAAGTNSEDEREDSTSSAQSAPEGTGEAYVERVETASRYSQSTLDAASATTVITAEDIRLSGAASIVDLLRRVPGVDLMRLGVGSANVSFRGFNQRVANKVLVLLDGRTEYLDFIGQTEWTAIPVDIHEIERIEIIRGPGSALYGANAMLGVINIITRRTGSAPRAELNATVGTGETLEGSVIGSGGNGSGFNYRSSAGYAQSDKWSRDFAEGRPDLVGSVRDPSLGLQLGRGNLAASYDFSPDVRLTGRAGASRFFTEVYPPGSLPNFFLDGVNSFGQLDLTAGPLALKFFWNHLDADVGPQYGVLGGRSLTSHLLSNVYDGELLVGKRFTLGGEHHAQIGGEIREKRVSWIFINGTVPELHAGAFLQDEWKPISALTFTGSYRIDYGPLLDAGRPGAVQSPRLAALWHPAEGHALRASYATSFREATFLERYTDITVPIPGVSGASFVNQGGRDLRPEKLVAFELGYRGESPSVGLDWDLSLYANQIYDLISLTNFTPHGYASSVDPATQSYRVATSTFANDATGYNAQGAELELRYVPVDRLELKASGAFEHVAAAQTPPGGLCAPCSQTPSVKLWGGITYRTPISVDLSVDGSYTSGTVWVERGPSATDLSTTVYTSNRLSSYFVLNARAAYRFWKDHVTLAVVGTDLGAAHAEHPYGNLISRRVFLTLTVTP